ncbi:MAG TPA: TlpA disulfide reductase family protein [Chitinophagaceae bacterium]
MKKQLMLIIFLGFSAIVYCQNALQECVQINFVKEDTTKNPADKFMAWIDCVNEKEIPSFSVKTLKDEKIKSKDLEGKIVVLNFWFIDCLPCIKELPALNRLVREYGKYKDVVFLSITWESKERIEKDFYSKYKLDFKVAANAQNVIDLFGKTGYPTTYVVGRDGHIKNAWLGGPIDDTAETEAYNRIKPVLDNLLK